MNKVAERNIVVVLFVVVLVLFSYADRDSKKLKQLYTGAGAAIHKPANTVSLAASKN